MLPKEIELTLDIEQGYVNHVNDRGGETKWGISRRSYPNLDIKNLTREEAGMILKRDYFDALRLAEVKDDSLRWKIFDMAVHFGQLRAKIYTQHALGVVADGVFGPQTLEALNSQDPQRVLARLIDKCVMHFTRIVTRDPSQLAFLEGWMKRAIKRIEV